MSLKAFHILFVSVSTLLSLGFGVWAVLGYCDGGSVGLLAAAAGALVVAVLLAGYGLWFCRKLKHLSFL